jgi:hypothetical protein
VLLAITTLALAGVALLHDLGFGWLLIIPVYTVVLFALTVWAHRRDVANPS